VTLCEIVINSTIKNPEPKSWSPFVTHANGVESPYSAMQLEFMHVDPAGQTVHEAPQALLSFVVLRHAPLHMLNPGKHATLQLDPEHESVAFTVVLHVAHVPLQHIPLVPHDVPAATSLVVATQLAVPLLHEIVPVTHGFVGVQLPPAVHETQLPLLHTSFVPHVVPVFVGVVVATHVDTPLLHEVIPFTHMFDGEHDTPAVHETQLPLSQTSFVPHTIPLGAEVLVATHVETPLPHDVAPIKHGFEGVHVVPAVHEPQFPLSQTSFVPHVVPFATCVVVATHVCTPLLHEVIPVTHGFVGVQARPAVHETHEPPLQTSFVPHVVPLATSTDVGTHVDVPLPQDVVPVTHGFVGLHEAPAVHETQLPLSQTSFVPQTVPLATWVAVAMQLDVPLLQEVVPVTHGFVGVHAVPATQEPQFPLLQTSPVPHVVPLATAVVVATQLDCPVLHDVVPVKHGFEGAHAVPATHEMQFPPLHTSFVPHVVPLATGVEVATQPDTPLLHEVSPVKHRFEGLHAVPATHETQLPLSQTSFVPQAVPFPALPVATQLCCPEAHDVDAVSHALLREHGAFAAHPRHAPSKQTSLVPQGVPFETFAAETHVAVPLAQDVVPVWHILPPGLHVPPGVHAPH
jgi:hypothetical protein